jgi:hypothetical protein
VTDKETQEISEMHQKVRERIRRARTGKHERMRSLAQTRFREAYSEADLLIDPEPPMVEKQDK